MENINWLMIAIFILGSGVLVGFFKTKTDGLGRFTTSVLLIIIVPTFTALLYAGDRLQGDVMANVFFAVFGFAGGLFTSKSGHEESK